VLVKRRRGARPLDLSVINGDSPAGPTPSVASALSARVVEEVGPPSTPCVTWDLVRVRYVVPHLHSSCGQLQSVRRGAFCALREGRGVPTPGRCFPGTSPFPPRRWISPVNSSMARPPSADTPSFRVLLAVKIDPDLPSIRALFRLRVLTGVVAGLNTGQVRRPGSSVAVSLGGVGSPLSSAPRFGRALGHRVGHFRRKLEGSAGDLGANASFHAADPDIVRK